MRKAELATWNDLRASGQFGRFVLLCVGVWLHAADSLVTATVVPSIVAEIGGLPYVSWSISLYQIGAIIAGAATAMSCRRYGMRRVLVLAALCYGFGCGIAALAPNMAVFLSARLVQGLGGGMMLSLGNVAIQQLFPARLWGRLFGVVAVVWAAGALLGPMIGGLFADLAAWRWAFWFFAAQAGVLAMTGSALLTAQPDRRGDKDGRGKWPLRPLILLAVATFAIAHAGVSGATFLSIVECLAGLALLYAAARFDRSAQSRLLPVQTLNPRHPVGAGLLTVFALAAATTGFWAYGPLILKILLGTDPLVSGYIIAGEALAWSAATMAISGITISAQRLLIRAGALLIAVSTAGFAFFVPTESFAGIVFCALASGFGFGLSWPSIMHRTVHCADEAEQRLAAAAPGTMQRIGYAVGAAATGIAANMAGLADGVSMSAARAAGFWIFAGFVPVLVVGVVAAWRFTRAGPYSDQVESPDR